MSSPSRSKCRSDVREVVQGDRAGMGDAERVERVAQPELAAARRRPRSPWMSQEAARAQHARRWRGRGTRSRPGCSGCMPVDGGEVLGQRVRRAVVVRRASSGCRRSAWASISQRPSRVSQSLAGGPFQLVFSPMSSASVAEDRRGPLDGVDLGDQRRDDQPRGLVDAVVAPAAVVRAQLVAEQRCARGRTACAGR